MSSREVPLVVSNGGRRSVIGTAVVELHGDTIEIHGTVTNQAYVRYLYDHPEEFTIGDILKVGRDGR